MKKLLSLLIVVITLFSLWACKNNNVTSEDLYNYPPLEEAFPDPGDHSELELFSFDTEDLLTVLDYRDICGRAEVDYEEGDDPRLFSRFYIYGKPFYSSIWPAISISGWADDSYLLPYRDFSSYSGITLDVRNATDREVQFNILYQDYDYVRLEPQFSIVLPANSDWISVKAPLVVPEGSSFNPAKMGQIQMWVFNLKKGESPIILEMDRMCFYKEAQTVKGV